MRIFIILSTFFLLFFSSQKATAQAWALLGEGLQAKPVAVHANTQNLYVLHESTQGTIRQWGVSIWNGLFWRELPKIELKAGIKLHTLFTYGGHLYVAGERLRVSPTGDSTNLIRWDGTSWKPIPLGFDTARDIRINDLTYYYGDLYAAGNFKLNDNISYPDLIRYNGTKPGHVDQTTLFLNGELFSLQTHRDTLWAGGVEINVFPQFHNALFAWDRFEITPVYSPFNVILKLGAHDQSLFAFGLDSANEQRLSLRRNGRWQKAMKGFDSMAYVTSFASFEGKMWAAGLFYTNGQTHFLLQWDGSQWQTLPGKLTGVEDLINWQGRLYSFGDFLFYNARYLQKAAVYSKGGRINGRVYYDENANCVFDGNDKPLPNRLVLVYPGPSLVSTDSQGQYSLQLPAGSYQAAIIPKKYWYIQPCNTKLYQITLEDTAEVSGIDFPMAILPQIRDFALRLSSGTGWRVRRGYREIYTLNYENAGSVDLSNGMVRVEFDPSMKDFISKPEATSRGPGYAEWKLEDLEGSVQLPSGRIGNIYFSFLIPTGFNPETITVSAEAQDITNDATPEDNQDSLEQTVGTESPLNRKEIYPRPSGPDSMSLLSTQQNEVEYVINFENTTGRTVKSVYVIDTIDLNLDIAYVQLTGSSHGYQIQVLNTDPKLAKGVLVWKLETIDLPPKPSDPSDDISYRGHVSFKLQLEDGVPVGTVIDNTAYLVFDDDAPIATNTVTAMMTAGSGINENISLTSGSLSAYPNPAKDRLTLQYAGSSFTQTQVFNSLGQVVWSGKLQPQQTLDLNVSQWPRGLYILQSGEGKVVKLVIE